MTQETALQAEAAEDTQASLLAEEATPLDLCDLHGVRPEWHPATEEECDWVLDKIANERDKIARVRKNADAQIKAAEDRMRFFEGRYGADLEAFARAKLAGQKGRSVTLLNGKLSFRTSAPRIKIDGDMARVVAWAKETGRGDMVKTVVTESVSRVDLAKEMRIESRLDTETGELVDMVVAGELGGVVPVAEVAPGEDRFSIG